jgi:tetratricopeptide (TPR) repeat protein
LNKAIDAFKSCLTLEKDHEKLGALHLQIGNCYYGLHRYIKAAEFYAFGLKESRKANDQQGQASNLVSIANTYLMRPASTGAARGDNVRRAIDNYEGVLKIFVKDEYPLQYAMTQNNLGNAYTALPAATPEQRAQNVRNAIECYKAALEIYKKDEYPIDYAMTQNNLGNAYTDLPAATPEQRAQNVRNAIEGYKAALEIYKKDEYPQDYCLTAANMGLILAEIEDRDASNWLKEAYVLRQFLPDQGKRLEDVMNRICD